MSEAKTLDAHEMYAKDPEYLALELVAMVEAGATYFHPLQIKAAEERGYAAGGQVTPKGLQALDAWIASGSGHAWRRVW